MEGVLGLTFSEVVLVLAKGLPGTNAFTHWNVLRKYARYCIHTARIYSFLLVWLVLRAGLHAWALLVSNAMWPQRLLGGGFHGCLVPVRL